MFFFNLLGMSIIVYNEPIQVYFLQNYLKTLLDKNESKLIK